MELDQQAHAEALVEAKRAAGLPVDESTLALAFAFGTGGVSPSKVAKPGKPAKRRQNKGPGNPNFQEQAHPRNAAGEFIEAGDSGRPVKAVQTALGIKNVDGSFGPKTVNRVRKFQRENGLQVDGIVGQQTAAALLGNDNAENVDPGALRPGQYHRLVKSLNGTNAGKSAGTDKGDGDGGTKYDGVGARIKRGKPIKSQQEDSLPEKETSRLAKAGWDYHDGFWWPPGHKKNKRG